MPAKYLSDWAMGGTEEDSVYEIKIKTQKGVMGSRQLDGGEVRVRIEPLEEKFYVVQKSLPDQWGKFSDGHCSIVVKGEGIGKALVQGFIALA